MWARRSRSTCEPDPACTGSGRTSRSGTRPAPRTGCCATAPAPPVNSSRSAARRGSRVEPNRPCSSETLRHSPGGLVVRGGASHDRRGMRSRATGGGRRDKGAREPPGRGAAPGSRRPGRARRTRPHHRVRRRTAAAHRRAHSAPGARPRARARRRLLAPCATARSPELTQRVDSRPPDEHRLHRVAARARSLGPPAHRLPTRPREAPLPRRGGHSLDADSARPVLHRGGPRALTRASGNPFALATSARSNVLQEFEGGPGQIALHGTNGLSGAPGTAASHGCIRLNTSAITWLARRIGSGVPLTIRG